MRRYSEWIIRQRWLVMGLTLLVTGILAFQIKNLQVVIDPNTILPHAHPFVSATDRVEQVFGSKYMVIIGITPKEGNAFSPPVLARVQRITAAILDLPGVVKGNVLSVAARKAKQIIGTDDGMEVRPLLEMMPQTPAEIAALRQAIRANPVYLNSIVSGDERTLAVLAEFQDSKSGFRDIIERINPIIERERDASVEIAVGGMPVFLAKIEAYSQRMAFLFPLAVLVIGLIHYEAFRTMAGLILPLVTALVAVVWGLGIMGLVGIPMDTFNATTPILILAVAAGHAVQILKRYYEEYHRLRATTNLSPRQANRAAATATLTRIGPVMLTAGTVAALGFCSLMVFEISTIRTFGVFTALGILSALLLEITFTHALRSILPAPRERESQREREPRGWDRITATIARWVISPARWKIYAGAALLVLIWGVGAAQVVVDNSTKDPFFRHLQFLQDDRTLNSRLGGTNTLYVLVEGREEGAVKDPKILMAIEATQRFLEQHAQVGKTLSLADFVKRMNRAMHGDDPAYERIPESRELISQYLLLYALAGEPGDFDTYVDYGYQSANIWVFLKTDSTAYFQALLVRLRDFVGRQFGDEVQVRFGGSVPQSAALNETMVHAKVLNIAQIGIAILLITSVVFRSLCAGLLVLVPLLAAVLANFGLMGWTGMPLNIPNSLTSAMSVGIGADYAIYLIYRLREELARGLDEATACRTALTTAGKAILFVASAVAGGYGVLLCSYGFYFHIWMALLIATAMLVSSLAALTILPCLILDLHPRFIFGTTPQRLTRAPEVVALLTLATVLGFLSSKTWAAELSARDIMQRNFIGAKVIDSTQDATITLINKASQQRVRKTFGATKLQDNGLDNMRMVRFLSPPDVKGTVTLLIEHADKDDDIWIYLPALKKVRRLVSSNKKDSFVGTDFSYGDVIGHKVEEWDHRLLGEEVVDEQPCYMIESVPKSESVQSSSGYTKRLTWIRKDNFVDIKREFWDQAGQLLKTSRFTDVQLVDPAQGKWQPMRLEMTNVQTGHQTVLTFENFKVNLGIKDDVFTTRYMERES
jgi:predicted RND superfamily exporter protein/outer membrane lipoprotein-sorting protein